MSLAPGTRLGHYEVVAAIGAGGMGEVYKARDGRLARDVAIKVLVAHAKESAQARARFKREAQAVAALQHPNICTIYDVGETDEGHAFIVMELLQGQTLQQRIARGALDVRAMVEIGAALADALQAAHSAGIVHRDIKPANILVTSRGPKVLDFGVAKATLTVPPADAAGAETRADLTQTGSTVGTVAYMSPEQLRGEEVDSRTDLFSLGLVLYEMATGRPAFTGNLATIGAAILHQPPAPPRTIRPELPEAFEQVVMKALEKDREFRYQSAADLRADLLRQQRPTDQSAPIATAVVSPLRRSNPVLWIGTAAAVAAAIGAGYWTWSRPSLPKLAETDTIVLSDFTNTTGDTVFDETLTLGLAVQLRQSPYLNILPDQRVRRVMTMMGQPTAARVTPAVAREVCERSSSTAVVEGSIASLGSQYVLGLRTTDCRSGEMLDTQQTQVASKEGVLAALSEMARSFRERVGESLATIRTHERPLFEATTASIEALRAFSLTRAPGFGGCNDRVPLYERAVQLDPEFALAHASVVTCYSTSGRRELAIQSATRAYELRARTTDPERFQIEYSYDRDVTGDLEHAFQTTTRWTQAYPRETQALGLRGGYGAHGTGRYEEVLEASARARAIDPDHVFARINTITASMFLDRFDVVKQEIAGAGDQLDPRALAMAYYVALLEQDTGSAERLAARFKDSDDYPLMLHAQSLALARAGQLDRAQTLEGQAIAAAEALGRHETAAIYESAAAVWEAWSGNLSTAAKRATRALSMSTGRDVSYAAGFALGLAGDTTKSESLADDLERRFPLDTIVRFTYVPTLRALAAVTRHNPDRAIELLQVNVPYERAVPPTAFNFFFGSLYPVYVRGLAFAGNGQHQQAVTEFQKMLDLRGLMMADPAGARVRLEKARSLARLGDRAGARGAYEDFLSLWKDADPNVPVLAQARAEYAKVK